MPEERSTYHDSRSKFAVQVLLLFSVRWLKKSITKVMNDRQEMVLH